MVSSGSSASKQISLPLVSDGDYSFTVDWGDTKTNTINTWDSSNATHTYDSEGVYDISISGTINGWRFGYGGDKFKIIEISQWGNLQLGNSDLYFFGAKNMEVTATDNLNLNGTESLAFAFDSCTSFGNTSDITGWDVSRVKDMRFMFRDIPDFDQPIGGWNVSQVTNFNGMFSGATSFNKPLKNWNMSKAQNIGWMFEDAIAFNRSINEWNTSGVTNMKGVFKGATSFNQPIGSWNVSQVTYMRYLFSQATSFNQPIGSWDVSQVTDMYYMFSGATSFNQPIGSWNVSQVTQMKLLFSHASSFNQPIGSWNVSQVTDMTEMFGFSKYNQSLDKWNVSNVNYMRNMFFYSKFNHPLNSWDVSNVYRMDKMFFNADYFNQPLNKWDVSSVESMHEMFSSADSFDQSLASWNVSSVETMDYLLSGTSLSTANYDEILKSWSNLSLQQEVLFSAGSTKYTMKAESSRQYIIDTYNWYISDGGIVTYIPNAPINVSFEIGDDTIIIAWTSPNFDGGEDILEYNVYKSTTVNGDYDMVGSKTNTEFIDYSVVPDTTYYYYVTALNAVGEGNKSTVIMVEYPANVPDAPFLQTISRHGSEAIEIMWEPRFDGGSEILEYRIYRSATEGGEFTLLATTTSLSYNDTDIIPSTKYYYSISAVNKVGESEYSEVTMMRSGDSPNSSSNTESNTESKTETTDLMSETNEKFEIIAIRYYLISFSLIFTILIHRRIIRKIPTRPTNPPKIR